MNKRPFRLIVVVLVVHTIVLALTRKDLRSRPESAVRGPKRLWRVWATLNTSGSLAYWVFGRKRAVEHVEAAPA